MNDFEAEFHKVQQEYQSKFGDILPTEEMPPGDLENIIQIARQCIRTNIPYNPPKISENSIS